MLETINHSSVSFLNILYIDDIQNDLDNFIASFSEYEENVGFPSEISSVNLTCITNIELLTDTNYVTQFNVIMCDHNMPEKKGLELIKSWLRPEHPQATYIIYSGAAENRVAKLCLENEILFIAKTEDISIVVEKIINQHRKMLLIKKPRINDGDNPIYAKLANEIISDIYDIPDSEFKLVIGEVAYSKDKLIKHLLQADKQGMSIVSWYIDGLKFFNK